MKADVGNRIKKLEKQLCINVDFHKYTIVYRKDYETEEEFEEDIEKYSKEGYYICII